MRQRKIKDIEKKLLEYEALLVHDFDAVRGSWRSLYNIDASNATEKSSRLYIELGCGRGRFINDTAVKFPNDYFVAVEGSDSVIYRALEKTHDAGIENIRYINQYIKDAELVFSEGEINGIFLNFSDPWPKERHEKRRLSAPDAIEKYKKILSDKGFIALKTDNEKFFEYSVEKLKEKELEIIEYTVDLHSSEYTENNVMTEYERKFINFGKKIMYVKVVKP